MQTQSTRDIVASTKAIRPRSLLAALAFSLLSGAPVTADDLEVFTSGLSADSKPNILFVLDYSASMLREVEGTNPQASRIEVLREAVGTVLEEGVDTINVGIGPLFSTNPGGVQWPIGPLDEDAHNIDPNIPPGTLTSADVINSLVNGQQTDWSTATVPALAEAALYFRGGNVYGGGADPDHSTRFTPPTWDTTSNSYRNGNSMAPKPGTYTPSDAYQVNANATGTHSWCINDSIGGGTNECAGLATYDCRILPARQLSEFITGRPSLNAREICKVPHPDRWNGANYVSPITNECQENFIVLISDGQPTYSPYPEPIEEILGHDVNACRNLADSIFATRPAGSRETGNCGFEIANTLASNDQNPNIPGSVVRTYTIGFAVEGPGKTFLEDLAKEGKGEFFEANRPEDLTDALRSIVDSILGDSESFAEVSVDINKATFSSDDRVYFPLFKPSLRPSWQGNVKGYFLDSEGIKDVRGRPATVDSNGNTVFVETSQSFWSSAADGNKSLEGGIAENLKPGNRNLYTFTGNVIPNRGVDLNSVAGSHDLSVSNNDVDFTLLDIPNDNTYRAELLSWIQQQPIGAPLHSKVQTINYAGGKRVLYTITNQGFLHAFDVSRPGRKGTNDLEGGDEIYAFMPKELLKNLDPQRTGITTSNHIYGLDGNITRWHDDLNNDGVVNNGEEILLIFGMRRGGSHYYAMDVTNPENPVLKWQIDGGQGQFQKLAQTWSRASLIRVNRNSGEERVLVFGGGYDGELDDLNNRQPSSGNSIFMVDRDGDLIWSATHPDMNYAIPSNITVIDSDSDTLADRMYFGDLGGQVWRIDMDNVDQNREFSIQLIADTSDGGYQPFFYAPSVALQNVPGGSYMTIAMGSGNRDNPLDAGSRNAFYVFKDENIEKGEPPVAPALIRHRSLYNATSNDVASNNDTIAQQAKNQLLNSPGWRIDLEDGEKSLSQTVTIAGRLLATTFQPGSNSAPTDACGPPPNTGRFYMLDIVTGEPVDHLGNADSNLPLRKENRSTEISSSGIPGSPVVIFPEGGLSAQILVNKELVSDIDIRVKRVYWFAEQ